MQQGQTAQSADKNTRRASILKGSSSKNRISSSNKMGQSTAIGQTVTFKEPNQDHYNIRQFRQDSPFRQIQQKHLEMEPPVMYSELMLLKDVKFMNTLYSNILLMITSADKQLQNDRPQNKDIKKMLASIERIIGQNKALKQQIEEQYKHVSDLHELAEYLNKTPEQLLVGSTLQDFLKNYCKKQKQLKELQEKCLEVKQKGSKDMKVGCLSEQEKREKEKRCRQLRKQIEKEKKKIAELEKQEKQLLKTLYKAQKEIIKNQRTSSTLKMKINEIECQRSYKLIKNRKKQLNRHTTIQKENIPEEYLQPKYLKIQNRERIKTKQSLAKFFKK